MLSNGLFCDKYGKESLSARGTHYITYNMEQQIHFRAYLNKLFAISYKTSTQSPQFKCDTV